MVAEGHLSHSIQEAEDREASHLKALLEMVNTSEVEGGAIEVMAEAGAADLVEDVEAQRK
jgi:hypothetical protein